MEKLQKEKFSLENHLVNFKLKYAEISSSFMEADDERVMLRKKNEDFYEKLKVKDEIIKNLLSDRDNIRNAYLSSSNINKNETFQNSNMNINNVSLTQRSICENVGNRTSSNDVNKPNMQKINKDKMSKKFNNLFIDNNDKSILSKNSQQLGNVKALFDLDKNYLAEQEKIAVVNSKKKPSTGFMGSLKNIFSSEKK